MRLVRLPGTYPAQADTWLLADALRRSGLARGRHVLDLCTGTGALAVVAAQAGAASVTAVDLARRAALSTWLTSRLNGAPVEVRRGDLFAPVAGRCFDLVIANPPYVPAAADALPRHRIARSWDAGTDGRALLDRIVAGVGQVLAPDGVVLLTQSTVSGEQATLRGLGEAGLQADVVARAVEPFGPVMRERAALLAERGLVQPHQAEEELIVVQARATAFVEALSPCRRAA